MAKTLNAFVHLINDDGTTVIYGPGDTVPAEDAARITNKSAWDGEDDAVIETIPIIAGTGGEAGGEVPPAAPQPTDEQKAAALKLQEADSTTPATVPAPPADAPDEEATVKELREYAKDKGITLGGASSKEEIRAAINASGK